MGVFAKIKGWLRMRLGARAKEVFGVKSMASGSMDSFVARCARIYAGMPDWLDEDNGIRTVNFARTICAEKALLTMLDTKVTISGGTARAAWLQEQVDGFYPRLREWVERCAALGTVILKPNGDGVEMLTPEQFVATSVSGGMITGAVFVSREHDSERDRYFTKLEYHRFTPDGKYEVSNRCFMGSTESDTGRPVPIEATPWSDQAEDVAMEGVDRPLFAVLRMPGVNNRDSDSALGMPAFADVLEELRDVDVAYSRMTGEVYDSRRIALVDDRLLESAGARVGAQSKVQLPDYVRKVSGIGAEEYYQQIDPSLNTAARLEGLNALLSQVGFKCGFSNGYFVFNEKTGMVTATQVESDDRRTVQMVKDLRDALESALDGLLYALDKWADLYDLAPVGTWEAVCDFGDITYNREEDRARWWGYVTQGVVPAWMYFVKFEGMSEEEARAMAAETATAAPAGVGLFAE